MPMIFISEEKNNPLEQEPYLSINRKLKDCGDDIIGKQIKYAISRHKSGFYDGFDLDRYYCDDIMLKFTFSKNKQANNAEEEMLIHHTIEYDFDLDFADIQQEAVNSIKKRMDYIYISNVSYLEYSYVIEKNHVQLSFDVLTNEACVSSVVNHLICQDIMIFSRGW